MDEPLPDKPPAGWYQDPADPQGIRYWDGNGWTDHVHTRSPAPLTAGQPAWGSPPPDWGVGDAAAGYGTYRPQSGLLTPSGMRRVEALFSDVGRILKRGWWPITAISLLLGTVWFLVAGIFTALLIDIAAFADAVGLSFSSAEQYPSGAIPTEVAQEIEQRLQDSIRGGPAVWVLAGVLLLLATVAVSCLQVAAVNRIAMDAASGSEVTLRAGVRSGLSGGLRLFGYALVIILAMAMAIAAITATVVAMAAVSPALAVVAALLLAAGLAAASVWVFARLIPLGAQCVVSRGALQWSWRATKDKFWAVLGRWVLWSIVASLGVQVISTAVALPVSLLVGVAASSGDPAAAGWSVAVMIAVLTPLSMVLNSATALGVVPIWRDLTDHPEYRSIEEGEPRP